MDYSGYIDYYNPHYYNPYYSEILVGYYRWYTIYINSEIIVNR